MHHTITPPPPETMQTPPKSSSLLPAVPTLSLPSIDDADGFGTFETAVDDVDGWGTPQKPTFALDSADALAWGAQPWEAPNSGAEIVDTRQEDDEWEIARRQKEKQDQHVPPELLAEIIHHLEELSADLWPEPPVENERDKERSVDIDSLGLNAAMQRLVPADLTLPPIVSFPKTFMSKHLSEALKLTRHSHLTKASPMALYMASKGSTSWEASIKAKPNIIQDDITPVGWKIVETKKEGSPTTEDGKKKPSGGLLSFFGRRGTTSSTETAKRSSSPVNSTISSIKTASPRASVDSGRPSTSNSVTAGRSTPSSPSVTTFASNTSQSATATSDPKPAPVMESYGNPSKDPMDAIVREPTPPPPSAVSRFLGRFSSRSKSSSKDSLALSSDDLEFLSDVPSFHGPETDQNASLDALSMMLKSPPLPTALPPPLAPPPKAPSKAPQMPSAPPRQSQSDDFMSFFDTLGDSAQGSSQPDPAFSLLTSVPTPPVKPSLASSSSSKLSTSIPLPNIPTFTIGSPDRPSDQISRQLRTSEDSSWPSFDYPSVPTSMSKPPPPQAKRAFVPIMSSSRPASTAPPPLLPKPTTPFALPPPPSANSQTTSTVDLLSGTSSIISPLPPPPGSRSHTPLRVQQPIPQPSTQSVNIDDDDDFADFLSSPAAVNPGFTPFNDFAAPTRVTNPPNLLNSIVQPTTSTSNAFDDFDDFLDTPPQPPAKSTSFASNSAVPSSTSSKPHNGTTKEKGPVNGLIRKVSKHDHSRTLSLLETAAARGRWLNPPSPLPEALQPPPSNNKSSNLALFGNGGGSMEAQQAQAVASLTTSHSSPAGFASFNGSTHKPSPTWNFPPPMQATPLKPTSPPPPPAGAGYDASKQRPLFPSPQLQNGNGVTPSTSKGTTSGSLSAQDLSFFEGL
ncbi:hypothetical protein BDN70DRAFT_832659 [Pholiota conissans]|uniref:Uncharacterized protein n=1 Tax=Pholiota conissans TaxID=109636 RepID=A0A9P6D1L5_9AGAR|nr:hypothetical protein BDN70DRAFT_832659 [Pholiota conissans]